MGAASSDAAPLFFLVMSRARFRAARRLGKNEHAVRRSG